MNEKIIDVLCVVAKIKTRKITKKMNKMRKTVEFQANQKIKKK